MPTPSKRPSDPFSSPAACTRNVNLVHPPRSRPTRCDASFRSASDSNRASRGFTLLEILLALAIIALLASVLIGGSAALLNDRTATPTEVFWKTVQACRKTPPTSTYRSANTRPLYDGRFLGIFRSVKSIEIGHAR